MVLVYAHGNRVFQIRSSLRRVVQQPHTSNSRASVFWRSPNILFESRTFQINSHTESGTVSLSARCAPQTFSPKHTCTHLEFTLGTSLRINNCMVTELFRLATTSLGWAERTCVGGELGHGDQGGHAIGKTGWAFAAGR